MKDKDEKMKIQTTVLFIGDASRAFDDTVIFAFHGEILTPFSILLTCMKISTDSISYVSCDMDKTVFFMKSFLVRMDKNC